MSIVEDLIAECKARLADIEKQGEHLVRADETQLRIAAHRLDLFAEHVAGIRVNAEGAAEAAASTEADDGAVADDGLDTPTRKQLNAKAAELGVEAPDKLRNKNAVIEAIRAASTEADETEE